MTENPFPRLLYEPMNDSADLSFVYPNQHIFEPEKGMLNWAINSLKTPLGYYVDFDSYSSLSELQTLVRAGWWKYNMANGNG